MNFPKVVSKYLARVERPETEAAVLSFDEFWNLQNQGGDLARFGLDEQTPEQLAMLFKEICIGLSRVRGAELKQISLPNGSAVDLHLFSAPACVHVLLLDVQEEVDKTREWQQSAQETKLRSYEKSRELNKSKTKLQSLREEHEALRREYLLLQGSLELLARTLSNPNSLLQLPNLAQNLRTLLPFEPPQNAEPLDVANLVAHLQKATGITLVFDPRSSSAPNLDSSALAATLLAALAQAQLRGATSIKASMNWDGATLLFSIFDDGKDFSTAQRLALWEGEVPKGESSELERVLLVLGARLRIAGGRVTARWNETRGMHLTLSIRNVLPTPQERTRILPAIGAEIWLLAQDPYCREFSHAALLASGFEVELFTTVGTLRERARHDPPIALLVEPAAEQGAGSKFAFQLRSGGFLGRIVALGELRGGPAMRSAFDTTLELPFSREQLLAALSV